jgi:hypothetical protein
MLKSNKSNTAIVLARIQKCSEKNNCKPEVSRNKKDPNQRLSL